MIPVYQDKVHKTLGNCVAACVASILERPLDRVPNFMLHDLHGLDWYIQWARFMAMEGYLLMGQIAADEEPHPECGVGGYTTATVPSQAFDGGKHCVVIDVKTFEIVHDPNRDNKPYNRSDIASYDLIVPVKFLAMRVNLNEEEYNL